MKKQPKFKEEFLRDYKKSLIMLYNFLFPLLEKGWSQEKVYSFVIFMEKNVERVKNKPLEEVLKIYHENIKKGAKI